MSLYLKKSDSALRWIHQISAYISPDDRYFQASVHEFLRKTWACKTRQDILDLAHNYMRDIFVLDEE